MKRSNYARNLFLPPSKRICQQLHKIGAPHPHSSLGTPGELQQAPHKTEGGVWSLQPQGITGLPNKVRSEGYLHNQENK